MTATAERQREKKRKAKILNIYQQGYNKTITWLRLSNYSIVCFLTSVGHEDFHSSILQQVSSGKDGADLCEQPFSMKTFCIVKNLEDRTGKQTPWKGVKFKTDNEDGKR